MQPRSRVRYLAPIALAAVLVAGYVVVHAGLNQKPAPAQSPSRHRVAGKRPRRFYRVGPGDNLTSIANRTGVPVGEIETLNPNVDPNSLQAGQRLRLRR